MQACTQLVEICECVCVCVCVLPYTETCRDVCVSQICRDA